MMEKNKLEKEIQIFTLLSGVVTAFLNIIYL